MIETLPNFVNEFIKQYFKMDILGVQITAPYYRNIKRVRAELRSLVGKGTPEELIEETVIYAKLHNFFFENKSEKDVREFMESEGIGIDCSGFISHVLDFWLKKSGVGGIGNNIKYPQASFRTTIARKLRVIENISADLLTNELNSTKVNLANVKPGDLLRLKGEKRGDHLAMIYSVEKDDFSKKVIRITYVHSSPAYGKENGLRLGEIEIIDQNKNLNEQKWLEIDDKNGTNYTFNGYLREKEDNGLRRLTFSHLLKWN